MIAFNYSVRYVSSCRSVGILPFTGQFPVPTGVTILGNSVFGNGGLGITFGGGVTPQPNDSGDADTGPNNRQNFPVLTSARTTPTGLSVRGTLNSRPNATYRIEFFGNSEIDPVLHGEGRTFLGFTEVTTDANGNAAFDAPIAVGSIITSTATDAAGNTSEFSQAIGQLLNISTRLRVRTGENVLIAGYIVTGAIRSESSFAGSVPRSRAAASRMGAGPDARIVQRKRGTAGGERQLEGSQQAEIEATTIPPTDDREPAIVRTLQAGNSAYTAVVRGERHDRDSGGRGLRSRSGSELQAREHQHPRFRRDGEQCPDRRLYRRERRGQGAGPRAGTIALQLRRDQPAAGSDSRLRDGNGSIALSNDNWRSSQEAEISATTIPPPNESEAAIVATLPPAPYTAVVRGKNDTTGVALVEVYALE